MQDAFTALQANGNLPAPQQRKWLAFSKFIALDRSKANGDTFLQQTQAVGLTLVNWAKALNLLEMHP